MFEEDFYLELVNGEYKKSLSKPLAAADLTAKDSRILLRLRKRFDQQPLQGDAFDHFRPARYFSEQFNSLEADVHL